MTQIHPTASISEDAAVGEGVVVGSQCIIGPGVTIGEGCVLDPGVIIERNTTVGARTRIYARAVIGGDPQDLKYNGEEAHVVIGTDCRIREFVTINRGTAASGQTIIGNNVYLMSYVHVAHDCEIQDGALLANSVQLGGHVVVEKGAAVGGLCPVHQFVRIGTLAFVGGGSRVPQDVPPYVLAAGSPIRTYGVNVVGLRRAGVDSETRLELKSLVRALFNSDRKRSDVINDFRGRDLSRESRNLLQFLEESDRGVGR